MLKGLTVLKYLIRLVTILCAMVYCQPAPHHHPFDWVLYRPTGQINAITEGTLFTYIATESGGVWRYNNYAFQFEEPLSTAQGLPANRTTAVHVDSNTGIIWVATPRFLCYSFDREGGWQKIGFDDLGLGRSDRIIQIGSDESYLWCRTRTLVIKCDRNSGIMIGQMINPDSDTIDWSGGFIPTYIDPVDILSDYSLFGGWDLFDRGLLDPKGEYHGITTFYRTRLGDSWIGTDRGTVFKSSPQMNTFENIPIGLVTADIQFILPYHGLWVSGRPGTQNEAGVSRIDIKRNVYDNFYSRNIINMAPQPLYSAMSIGDELWFGGNGQILVYNKNLDSWRTLNEANGVPPGRINVLVHSKSRVWIGSSRGIGCLAVGSYQKLLTGLESVYSEQYISDLAVYGNSLWIASVQNLRILEFDDNRLMEYKQYYRNESFQPEFDTFSGFTSLTINGDSLLVGTSTGILSFNKTSGQWSKILSPVIYKGKYIRSMDRDDNYLWLAVNDGLFRISTETGSYREYDYNFMGNMNDVYISGDEIWIGTTEGLIKFIWRIDQ